MDDYQFGPRKDRSSGAETAAVSVVVGLAALLGGAAGYGAVMAVAPLAGWSLHSFWLPVIGAITGMCGGAGVALQMASRGTAIGIGAGMIAGPVLALVTAFLVCAPMMPWNRPRGEDDPFVDEFGFTDPKNAERLAKQIMAGELPDGHGPNVTGLLKRGGKLTPETANALFDFYTEKKWWAWEILNQPVSASRMHQSLAAEPDNHHAMIYLAQNPTAPVEVIDMVATLLAISENDFVRYHAGVSEALLKRDDLSLQTLAILSESEHASVSEEAKRRLRKHPMFASTSDLTLKREEARESEEARRARARDRAARAKSGSGSSRVQSVAP